MLKSFFKWFKKEDVLETLLVNAFLFGFWGLMVIFEYITFTILDNL